MAAEKKLAILKSAEVEIRKLKRQREIFRESGLVELTDFISEMCPTHTIEISEGTSKLLGDESSMPPHVRISRMLSDVNDEDRARQESDFIPNAAESVFLIGVSDMLVMQAGNRDRAGFPIGKDDVQVFEYSSSHDIRWYLRDAVRLMGRKRILDYKFGNEFVAYFRAERKASEMLVR